MNGKTVRHKTPWRVFILCLVAFLMTDVFLEGSTVYAQKLVIRQSDAPLLKNSTRNRNGP